MSTPNLDAVGHWWVAALVGYNFTIEYLKGPDNKVANGLSWVEECLDGKAIQQLFSHASYPTEPWAKAENPHLMQEHV